MMNNPIQKNNDEPHTLIFGDSEGRRRVRRVAPRTKRPRPEEKEDLPQGLARRRTQQPIDESRFV